MFGPQEKISGHTHQNDGKDNLQLQGKLDSTDFLRILWNYKGASTKAHIIYRVYEKGIGYTAFFQDWGKIDTLQMFSAGL